MNVDGGFSRFRMSGDGGNSTSSNGPKTGLGPKKGKGRPGTAASPPANAQAEPDNSPRPEGKLGLGPKR